MPHDSRGPEPAVYARLSAEADVREARRSPHPAARVTGWVIVGLIAFFVMAVVLWAGG